MCLSDLSVAILVTGQPLYTFLPSERDNRSIKMMKMGSTSQKAELQKREIRKETTNEAVISDLS